MGINTGSSWDRFNFELRLLQNFAKSKDDSSILLTLWDQNFKETMNKIAADPNLTSSQSKSVHAFLELANELTSSSGDPADDRKKLNDFIDEHQLKQTSDHQAKGMQAKSDRRDSLKEKITKGISKKLKNQTEVQQVKKAMGKLSSTAQNKLEEAKDFVKEGQKMFTIMSKLKDQKGGLKNSPENTKKATKETFKHLNRPRK